MKHALFALSFCVGLASAPLASFAQSTQASAGVTRAQVRAELAQLEEAGYTPGADAYDYPDNLLAAEARVQAKRAQSAAAGAPRAVADLRRRGSANIDYPTRSRPLDPSRSI